MEKNNTLQEERIDTDVLVVGAGAGGLMAAITAADYGARVTLCEKGNAMRSGGIYGGNDHITCYIPGIHSPAVRERIKDRTLSRGFIDEDIVYKQIDLTCDVVKKWESWGINMKTNGHYEFTGHSWPGSSGKMGEPGKTDRTLLHFSDKDSCVKLEKQVRDRGIRIMNRVMVHELLRDPLGHVVGAVGIGTREPKIYIFRAKSVVLNQGQVDQNRLYASPHVISFGMAIPGTGDGIIMAYRAGADVQNAELCHRQTAQRFGPTYGRGTWIGVVRDTFGQPIAPPYLSRPDAETGDVSIENPDALDHVWATGKGPVWMDSRGISEEDESYMKWGFQSEALEPLLRWFEQEKIDIKKTRFEFIPLQPRTRIQIRMDIDYKTSIEGLYAIYYGTLYMNSVGGLIAGESAAKNAQGIDFSDMAIHNGKISNLKQWYEELLNREGMQFADWHEAQWAIGQTMHCYALPPNRTEHTLMAGHNQLLRLKGKAYNILKAANQHDLYHCLEVLNLMDIAELVTLAVNERKESRDQARRQDYPFTNPLLNKFMVITRKDGRPAFRWENPRRVSR
ncbi:FAD-binding protein [Chloroflexota bacterium]